MTRPSLTAFRYPHGESSAPRNTASYAASENSGPYSGPVEAGSELVDLLRLLAGLTAEERRGLLDLAREAAERRASS